MTTEYSHILDSLGWTLIHSLWQGALAVILVILVRTLIKDKAASLRYMLQISVLTGCLLAFIATLWLELGRTSSPVHLNLFNSTSPISAKVNPAAGIDTPHSVANEALNTPKALDVTESVGPQSLNPFELVNRTWALRQLTKFVPYTGLIWCIGFAILLLRYGLSFALAQQLRRKGLTPVPAIWQRRLNLLARNSAIYKPLGFYISNRVSDPLTLGFFKPIILVPASFLTQLPTDQIEAILLHEIAHIRRHDYAINLLQMVVKTVFFYHPAIHFISKKIDQEREHACDDFAVRQLRDPSSLMQGLAALSFAKPAQAFTMAASGHNMPLLTRIQRLSGTRRAQKRSGGAIISALSIILAGSLLIGTSSGADTIVEPEIITPPKVVLTPALSPLPLTAPAASVAPAATPQHPQAAKHNYRFETIHKNGHQVTAKIAENGTRWVNKNGAWVDVDKNPTAADSTLAGAPKVPNPPQVKPKSESSWEKTYQKKMQQFEIDMQYFEASMKRFSKLQATANSSQDFDQSFVAAQRAWEKAEAQLERAEQQLELAEKRREQIERQQEMAQRQQEQAQRQQEMTQRQQEQAERQQEQVERQREHVKRTAYRAAQTQKNEALKATLIKQLKKDGYMTKASQTMKLVSTDKSWRVNGKRVPDAMEAPYCDALKAAGIQKTKETQITIKPDLFEIISMSDGKNGYRHISHDSKSKYKTEHKHKTKSHKHSSYNESDEVDFKRPVKNMHVTSKFGKHMIQGIYQDHKGIDLAGPIGTPVMASANGTVSFAGYKSGWGNIIELTHIGGYTSIYASLDEIQVKPGENIKSGQTVGTIGLSAKTATVPHLHFGIYRHGYPKDPLNMTQGL